jgi:hypothetical protein
VEDGAVCQELCKRQDHARAAARHRRAPHAREAGEERDGAAVPAGGVRHPLQPRHLGRGRSVRSRVECGIVEKSGARLSFEGERIGQGRENTRKLLLEETRRARAAGRQIDARKWAAAPVLSPFLRPDLNANVALQMLDHFVTWAADPRSAERLGVSRREAVRTAVSLWGDGALQRAPRLRAVPSAAKSR